MLRVENQPFFFVLWSILQLCLHWQLVIIICLNMLVAKSELSICVILFWAIWYISALKVYSFRIEFLLFLWYELNLLRLHLDGRIWVDLIANSYLKSIVSVWLNNRMNELKSFVIFKYIYFSSISYPPSNLVIWNPRISYPFTNPNLFIQTQPNRFIIYKWRMRYPSTHLLNVKVNINWIPDLNLWIEFLNVGLFDYVYKFWEELVPAISWSLNSFFNKLWCH